MASTPGTTALPSRTWFNNPQNPAEVCANFDYIHSNLSLYGKGLDRHNEKIREDRKTIETVKSRLDAQERWNNHHEQLITDVEKKAEVDIERLRSDLDAEKAQSRQLATCLTKVVEAVAEIQRSFTAPRSNTVPGNRTPLENERRRSSQKEAPLPEAVVKLSQRMDELSNQAVGNKTIVHANLQRIDRVIQENAQRIASLKGSSNMDNQRIESLERRSNMDNQRIDELELDVVHRFDTAVVNAQEGLRHNHDTWVKGLESLRAETMESITTTTNRLASDQKTVQSQVNEHTKTFEKHGEVLERISRRVKEVETARDSSGTAATACEAMTTSPKPLHTRLEVLENSHTALQTATLNLSTATTSASDLKDLRFEVDTLKSRSDNDIVISVNLRNRVSALEESYETAAFAKIKERLTILEKSCSENNDAQSVMDNSRAKYVTHEQFIAATDSLASVLNTKIQNNKDELEKALACDIMMLEKQCSRQLESMKTNDENVVRENPCLQPPRPTDIALPTREPAPPSVYPSPPATTGLGPFTSTRNSPSTNTPSAETALQLPKTGKMPTTQDIANPQQAMPNPSDATDKPPRQFCPPTSSGGDLGAPSASSSRTSFEPFRRVQSNPASEIVNLRPPTTTSDNVPRPHIILPREQQQHPTRQHEPPPHQYQHILSIPRPSAALPPLLSQPVFFRHNAPRAVVTEQYPQYPQQQHPLSNTMGGMYGQADVGSRMEWSVTGHPDVQLVRARQLQQSGGAIDYTPK